jgi:hypothetical protein
MVTYDYANRFTSIQKRAVREAMKPNRLILMLLGWVVTGGGGLVWAQAITLSPSLTVLETYDDNVLLSSTDRRSDFVTSITPGLRLTARDPRWDVTLAAAARADYYADRPELNNTTDNQNGNLAIAFRATPRLTISLNDTFIRSLDPGEVDTATGITTGRFRSYGNTVTPAIKYQITPLTLVGLDYSFAILRSDSPFTRDEDTHEGRLSVERQFTPRNSGTFRYTFSRFKVEGEPDRDAHSPRVGLIHILSPTIRISAEAGVLLFERADGATEVSPSGTLRYDQEFSQGRLSLSYDRSARLAGLDGVAGASQALTATAAFTATRNLTLDLRTGVSTTESVDTEEEVRQGFFGGSITFGAGRLFTTGREVTLGLESEIRATDSINRVEDFLVYTGGIRFNYRFIEWLSINVGYRHTRQDDKTGPFDLERNTIFVGLTTSTDFRFY